jgi:tRNA nucleotidyltransferase/poly(A) polymerase
LKLVTESGVAMLGRVSRYLNGQGIKSYLVGGTVRDTLLNRQTTGDIDIAVSGDAMDIARRLAAHINGKFILLDESNKIGRVVVTDDTQVPSEYRTFDISALRGTIDADLGLRDFTIDAMAVELTADLADSF